MLLGNVKAPLMSAFQPGYGGMPSGVEEARLTDDRAMFSGAVKAPLRRQGSGWGGTFGLTLSQTYGR